jgi:hypothetical protein
MTTILRLGAMGHQMSQPVTHDVAPTASRSNRTSS